jgi:F-type H+-transporting ATPase subunit a
MHWLKQLLALALLAGLPLRSLAADAVVPAEAAVGQAAAAAQGADAGGHGEGEHHGLPPAAVPLFHIGPLPVTNSMVVTWVVALGLIVLARRAMRQVRDVPEGGQNFWEWLVESLHDFLEGIIGPDLVKKTFWFFATIFIFILFSNWFGLIPGVGTVFYKGAPILRGANADLNMTFGMAMIFFVLWTVWALQFNGPKGFVLHIFGPKGDTTGFLKILMIGVFILVGLLELVTILFRPVTLSFRLYGNIFAGENMLEAMAALVQHPAWLKAVCSVLVPIPFYFLELIVGLVQALVFMLLTAVFTMLICTHEEGHGHEKAH